MADQAPRKPKKTPAQKRAETAAKRKEWSDQEIADAFAANGGSPKGGTPTPTAGPGRPSKYPTIDLELVESLAAGGLSKAEIAQALGIVYDTLRIYQNEYSAFSAAIERGRALDVKQVENAMHKAAKGYTFTEDKVFYDSQVGKVVIQPTVKRIAPDTKAGLAILLHAETGSWKPRSDVEVKFPEPLVIKTKDGKAIESLGIESAPDK